MPLCYALYGDASLRHAFLHVASLRYVFLYYASLRDNIPIISTQSQLQ